VVDYLEKNELSIEIINDYYSLFINENQRHKFHLKWYLDLSNNEREFLEQAIKHFKLDIFRNSNLLDNNSKKS
jgi:hypothetical protein